MLDSLVRVSRRVGWTHMTASVPGGSRKKNRMEKDLFRVRVHALDRHGERDTHTKRNVGRHRRGARSVLRHTARSRYDPTEQSPSISTKVSWHGSPSDASRPSPFNRTSRPLMIISSTGSQGRRTRSTKTTYLSFGNDPSAGSPTETLLRLLLPLNDQV